MAAELNFEIILILIVLSTTIILFVTELFRIDFSAILVMVTLGILNQLPSVSYFLLRLTFSLDFLQMQLFQLLQ